MMLQLSIIVPVLNEAEHIVETLSGLQYLRTQGQELIVVDGGSGDDTVLLARPLCDQLLLSAAGRSRQMNVGAAAATGQTLLFLHADTLLPNPFFELMQSQLANSKKQWGRFNVRLSGGRWVFRIIETMMNARSCLTGVATGDQAIFVSKSLFDVVGGFSDIPLMEDIVLSTQLKKIGRPLCLKLRVETSSRRWESRGVVNTVLLMWWLRLAFFLGVGAEKLARMYR